MVARADSLFDACLKEGLVLSAEWVPRWLAALGSALQQREAAAVGMSEKHSVGKARSTLATHHKLVTEHFLAALGQSLGTAASGDGDLDPVSGKAPPRRLDMLSFDELELMDHQQVQDTVELARIQQVVHMAVDDELVMLDARLSSARGLTVVRSKANPLHPEAIIGALIRALSILHIEDAVRVQWLHIGALPLGQELQGFYQQMIDLLDRWGVQPAGYKVVQTPVGKPLDGGTSRSREDSVPMAALTGKNELLTLDHLHQLLVGNMGGGSGLADSSQALEAGSMVRSLAVEVVTLMLRRIADDVRLLEPVREMLLRLKPVLLELARNDPRFFADRSNPARRLLDVLTERALAFKSEHDAGFEAYAQQLRKVLQDLQVPASQLSQRIAKLLTSLGRSDPVTQAPARGLAMQTLVKVEQRNLLAQRVAAEIQARNDFARAPGVVRRFLAGPWAQVVAQARIQAQAIEGLAPGDAPALRYMDILPDLLWSSRFELASLNRPRLIKVIPGLLRTLRDGLDSIDFPRAQADSFFQALMELHEVTYKPKRNEPVDTPDRLGGQLEPDLPDTWVHPAEARDSGFMDDMFIESQPAFQDTEPLGTDWRSLRETEMAASRPLAVGTWVDLRDGAQDLRCQLTWASPSGSMFLFNAANGRSVSLTLRGLDRLRSTGRLRVVAEHGLVDDALDEVTRQALINSGRS
ncbi:DUF1631 family protein [Hydrogenophaga sp. A37]|uniref:DUF1631 family protein n=1 Tax=Hydrogenophaga sp. A37 TaxID=1945864 RepID=UPI0009872D36|nr:DUF1631 family protein [Hydrogenophaga sp. A37]OOG84024.1 hypothetical protein B0E41_11315 [Hydrogenophaga sp. A37]